MGSIKSSVQQAVRKALSSGRELHTPAGGNCFTIESLYDPRGLKVSKLTQPISWKALNGVPHYMASLGGTIEIGAKKGKADRDTLERFLQEQHGNVMMRGSYAAPILKAAGVVDILPRVPGEKQRIRLREQWTPSI